MSPWPSFTLAHACILVAALLPYLCAGIAKWGAFRIAPDQGGYDNDNPRAWLARQADWRARANAAQANSFEGLPFFIGAVLVALQLGAPQGRVDALALAYVLLRVLYIACYVRGWATARSAVWALAMAANIALMFVGFRLLP